MSKVNINIGASANDGTGDPLRTAYQNLNSMMAEIYTQKQKELDFNAKIINEYDDIYAHESQIIMKRVDSTTFLFFLYCSNKITETEWDHSTRALLRVFELTTMTHLKTFQLFYPGLTAGITMPAGKEINCPKMYFIGNNIRFYCPNTDTLYTREIDISTDDYASWTPTDITISQMTMKNAVGADVLADVTAANIEIHLDYVLGDGYPGYHDLMPMFRNFDAGISGANYYMALQLSGERSHSLPAPTVIVISNDSGDTWKFGSLIGYTISNRFQVIEPSIIFYGTELWLYCRTTTNAIARFRSIDYGLTWIKQTDIPFNTIDTKPCAINYTPDLGGQTNAIAVNLATDLSDYTGRNTLGIYKMVDSSTYTEIAKISVATVAHYPCLCYFSKALYLSYTKGMKSNSTYCDRNTIAFTRIL
jgi:hypothetical protein